jgi:hypothetical protein
MRLGAIFLETRFAQFFARCGGAYVALGAATVVNTSVTTGRSSRPFAGTRSTAARTIVAEHRPRRGNPFPTLPDAHPCPRAPMAARSRRAIPSRWSTPASRAMRLFSHFGTIHSLESLIKATLTGRN